MHAPQYAVDVRPILEDLGGTVRVDAEVELPLLTVGTEEFAPRSPAHLRLDVTNTGAGIVASGTVDAMFDAVCSRCLGSFPLSITGEVEGFFVAHGSEHELPDEQEYGFVEEGAVDVMPAVLTALALEAPFAPLHDTACKGICPTCGADRNIETCACSPSESSSPFAMLRELLPEGEDDA